MVVLVWGMCSNAHSTVCTWVFVLISPLQWNGTVTVSELFIPRGHSSMFWICQDSDRKAEVTTHTSHCYRALPVSKRNSHWLFLLGKNRNILRAFSHCLSMARSRTGNQDKNKNTQLLLNGAIFSFRNHNDNNAIFAIYEVPVMYQALHSLTQMLKTAL